MEVDSKMNTLSSLAQAETGLPHTALLPAYPKQRVMVNSKSGILCGQTDRVVWNEAVAPMAAMLLKFSHSGISATGQALPSPDMTLLWFLEERQGPRGPGPRTVPKSSWAQKPGGRLRADPQKSCSLHGKGGPGSREEA